YNLNIQTKQHEETSQSLNQQQLGLLKKHKDHVKHARDYHPKQDQIHKLHEKAAVKYLDEVYFGMINSSPNKDVHVESWGHKALETDLVMLLNTQDFQYVKTCQAIEGQVSIEWS
ncbi:hypothetical protein CROQUDRAFT_700697, partial [Cronartium quercuum f. sp. fusiforme G11]